MSFLLSVLIFILIITTLSGGVLVFTRLLTPKGQIKLNINNSQKIFSVNRGETLLNLLYSNSIFIPSGCGGKGSCGLCKVKIISGEKTPHPHEQEFLSASDMKNGVRLSCQMKLFADTSVEISKDFLDAKLRIAVLEKTTMVTGDIREIIFSLPEPLYFNCGQYIQVLIPGDDQDKNFRAYSIASPSEETLRFALNVKLIQGGMGSTYLHSLKEGEQIQFTGPYGEWMVDASETTDLLLVGGGVGMAPMRSIVQTVLSTNPRKKVTFFFGGCTLNDLLFRDDFERLASEYKNFTYICAVSDELKECTERKGFIHKAISDEYSPPSSDCQVFLCGPPVMIDAVNDVLIDKGIEEKDIFYDKF
ncbi:MAG: 2Fe-2S iron-sulfur cluster binding domain-containing protein [Deltaproteobacteria bacterium]|nr:2Fe-2S iron-sulfur cluster binding domain-containing protein [Deltaproteobacteria bacterium]